MLPWFEPEITPHVAASGVRRFDLDPSDRARNVRAVVEAQMMAMANHAAPFTGSRVDRIVATGGASANRAILQVMADVFGAPVAPQAVGNAACLGAALRALHADSVADGESIEWADVVRGFTDPAPGTEVAPVPAHTAIYDQVRTRYATIEAEAIGGPA
jgi:xylulokinase